MKRKKTVAEVVCEKKLKRKVIDGLKQLMRCVLKAKGLTTPTAKMLSFYTFFSFFLKSPVGDIKE